VPALIFVSILWAFSFGLIKGELTGLDPTLVAHIRLLLSFIVFLPFAVIAKQYKPN
jgi:drug/metabolite transporter (DMT)-like permease